MNRYTTGSGRLVGMLIILLMAWACGDNGLPDVPDFEALGFADALDAVREQVHGVYEQWQEEPRDAERNGRLGMHLSVYGKGAAAEVLFRRAQALAPGDFRWPYYLAFTLIELGRLDEAAAVYREALKIDPGHVQARIHLAAIMWRMSDIEGSGKLYESITVDYPKRVEGWLGLGKVYSRLGDKEAAEAALRRARAVGPQYGEVHYALAQVLRERGDEADAAGELAAYARTADNKIGAADKLVEKVNALHIGDESFLVRGNKKYRQGRFKRAAQLFRIALEKNPASANAWVLLVSSHVKLGELDAAGDAYREALAAGIAYAWLHLVYGQALLEAGQLNAARDAIGKAIVLDPQYADAYSTMGELEIRNGASAAAVEQFRLALAARPNDRHVRLSLARALNTVGQFEEAADQLEPLTTDPTRDRSKTLKELARAFEGMALAYYGMDRKDDAIDALRRGLDAARTSFNRPMVEKFEGLLAEWQQASSE